MNQPWSFEPHTLPNLQKNTKNGVITEALLAAVKRQSAPTELVTTIISAFRINNKKQWRRA
jgi:hypothetical protein